MNWRLILLCVSLMASVSAQPIPSAARDSFLPLPMDALNPEGGCGGDNTLAAGQIIVGTTSFSFYEGNQSAGGIELNGPAARTTCAAANWNVDLPPGTDAVHVRFIADRNVVQAVTAPINMVQQLNFSRGDGSSFESVPVFEPSAESSGKVDFTELGLNDQPRFPVGDDWTDINIGWFFMDAGQPQTAELPLNPASGQEFFATVYEPELYFEGRLDGVEVHRHDERAGDEIRHHSVIAMNGDGSSNLRVRVAAGALFSHVEAPDGSRLENLGVLGEPEDYAPNLAFIIKREDTAAGYLEVVLPAAMQDDEGRYEFHFLAVEALEPEAGILAVNGMVVLLPFIFAGLAYRDVNIFRREAFGSLSRAARNLMVTLALVLAYYVAFLIGMMIAGWYPLMAVLPPGREAYIGWSQVVLAVAAFVGLWLTARALYQVTKPQV